MVECLILFTGFTDALWPLNLNISDDFKVHSKGAFNNYTVVKRGHTEGIEREKTSSQNSQGIALDF